MSQPAYTSTLNARTVASTALTTSTVTATTSTNATTKPPASPRAPGSLKSPRSHLPPLDAKSVAEKNKQLAIADAWRISNTTPGSDDLDSVLSQVAAVAPAERGPVLNALAMSIYPFHENDQPACLREIRELATGLPRKDRQMLVNELLRHYVGGSDTDEEDEESSNLDRSTDQRRWQKDQSARNKLSAQIESLMASPVQFEMLEKLIGTTRSRRPRRQYIFVDCLAAVIDGLGHLDEASQNKVVGILKTGCDDVALLLGALFASHWLSEMSPLARQDSCSLSALLMGTLEGDDAAKQQLLLILGRLPLPRGLHLLLCLRIRAMKNQGVPEIETQLIALLIDAALLADMPESSKCLLVHRLYMANRRLVLDALRKMPAASGTDSLGNMHKAIASCIDIGACYTVANSKSDAGSPAQGGDDSWRAPYSKRADRIKTLTDKGRTELRRLLCDIQDPKAISGFVKDILGSNLAQEDKIKILEGRANSLPGTDKSRWHIYFDGLKKSYCEKYGKNPEDHPDYPPLDQDEKSNEKAHAFFYKHLPPEIMEKHKREFRTARATAEQSRLPALQVAILAGNALAVSAYIKAVLEYCATLDPEEVSQPKISKLLEFRDKEGRSSFYMAMMDGSPDVITAYARAVMDSALPEATKVDLLEARRDPDRFGAFFIAMAMADTPRVHAFMTTVLENNTITPEAKTNLLRCKKAAQSSIGELSDDVLKRWQEAPYTAIAAADARARRDEPITKKARRKKAKAGNGEDYKTAKGSDVIALYKSLVHNSPLNETEKQWALSKS